MKLLEALASECVHHLFTTLWGCELLIRKRENKMREKILIEKMEDGYLFYLKNGIIESVKVPAYGKLTLVYQHGKVCYVEKTETIK